MPLRMLQGKRSSKNTLVDPGLASAVMLAGKVEHDRRRMRFHGALMLCATLIAHPDLR